MAKVVLSKILKQKKLTVYAFAKLIGVTQPNLVRAMGPDANPRLDTLEKWAKALKVSVKDLIED